MHKRTSDHRMYDDFTFICIDRDKKKDENSFK